MTPPGETRTDLRFRPEPYPIVDVCEAIAYNYAQALPDDIRDALAEPDGELVETISNLIELRPGRAAYCDAPAGGQLTLGDAA